MAELWDLYDVNRNPLGRTHERGKPIRAGEYHIVVQICVQDAKGRLLMTRRHPDKVDGCKWEVTAGSALAGEDSATGALRELREETGLSVSGERMKPFFSRLGEDYFFDSYLVQLDEDGENVRLTMQEGETTDYIWADYETQEQMERDGLLVLIAREARTHMKR
ncbi:MAG: NUDIX domain-containing protein [Clostridia bacterium]|nr:NUDIX domain-containing protein [Clostridia bacterium]